MPNLVGPSHHVFHGAMVRRYLWLQRLIDAYKEASGNVREDIAGAKLGDPETFAALERTQRLQTPALKRAQALTSLGIQKPYPLNSILDDTPIDSFLTRFYEDLCAFENHLFTLLEQYHARRTPRDEEIVRQWVRGICALWGREIAGEMTITPLQHAPLAPSKQRSLQGIFERLYQVLEGGDLRWKPLLPRRLTDTEIQYEPRYCPHTRSQTPSAQSLACELESVVYAEFARFFAPNMTYKRSRTTYCFDTLVCNPGHES